MACGTRGRGRKLRFGCDAYLRATSVIANRWVKAFRNWRVDIGTGYRVYYGKHGQALIILLCGGDKGSQQANITRAEAYWANWKRRKS